MFANPMSAADDQHESSAPDADIVDVEEDDSGIQTLPHGLTKRLGEHTSGAFHTRSATRLMLFDTSASAADVPLHDYHFNGIIGTMRTLLYSWHTIFLDLQQQSLVMNPRSNTTASPDEWSQYLLSVSRAYRAELEVCLIEAAGQLNEADNPQAFAALKRELKSANIPLDDYKYQLILLETCKSLFHLIEIFYIDPYLNLTSQLIDWIHRTLQLPEVELTQEEEEDGAQVDVMRDTDAYWECIYRMLLQGRLYEALQLLNTCQELVGVNSPHRQTMRRMMDAIETVPALARESSSSSTQQQGDTNSSAHIPIDQFLLQFKSWQKNVESIMQSDELQREPHPHIELALQILLGDESSLLSCARSNYLEYFISTLIYIKPYLQNSKHEMMLILQKCMKEGEERWKQDRRDALKERMENGSDENGDDEEEELDTEEAISSSTLYTPIDTLRYHLISSDITSALNIMNSMIDLPFFMAHIIYLLDQHGEIIHSSSASGAVEPLRLNHSSINDDITLKEYYLIAYGENLESIAASASSSSSAATSLCDDLHLLAVEYYAVCKENGREYISNLLLKQPLTKTIVHEDNGSGQRLQTIFLTKKLHKLLSLASRFSFTSEYNSLLLIAASQCFKLARDALDSNVASSTWFGQATFWLSMIQPDSKQQAQIQQTEEGDITLAVISPDAIKKFELMAEYLLDQILLQKLTNPTKLQLILQAMLGVLTHVPAQLIRSMESIKSASHLLDAANYSPILSVMAAYRSYCLFQTRCTEITEEIRIAKNELMNAPTISDEQQDEDMNDVIHAASSLANSTAKLHLLLSLHAYCHSQSIATLVSILRHASMLLAEKRKYWIVLIVQLMDLLDAKQPASAANTLSSSSSPSSSSQVTSWYDLNHPALQPISNIALPQTPTSSSITLATLTHVQRLLTSLLHSNTAELYLRTVGGKEMAKKIQGRLNTIVQQTTSRQR